VWVACFVPRSAHRHWRNGGTISGDIGGGNVASANYTSILGEKNKKATTEYEALQ
jgi:hypothetical protein